LHQRSCSVQIRKLTISSPGGDQRSPCWGALAVDRGRLASLRWDALFSLAAQRPNNDRNSASAPGNWSRPRRDFNLTTTSQPSAGGRPRKHARAIRLSRLRCTAKGSSRRPMTTPSRLNPKLFSTIDSVSQRPAKRWRARSTRLNAAAPVSLARRVMPTSSADCHQRNPPLQRQAMAPFCAPSVEYLAAAQRLHTGAKPMRSGSPDFRWLISPLHIDSVPSLGEKPAITRVRRCLCQLDSGWPQSILWIT